MKHSDNIFCTNSQNYTVLTLDYISFGLHLILDKRNKKWTLILYFTKLSEINQGNEWPDHLNILSLIIRNLFTKTSEEFHNDSKSQSNYHKQSGKFQIRNLANKLMNPKL